MLYMQVLWTRKGGATAGVFLPKDYTVHVLGFEVKRKLTIYVQS